jgi:hypothetical protein
MCATLPGPAQMIRSARQRPVAAQVHAPARRHEDVRRDPVARQHGVGLVQRGLEVAGIQPVDRGPVEPGGAERHARIATQLLEQVGLLCGMAAASRSVARLGAPAAGQ